MASRLISFNVSREIILDLDDVIADAAPQFQLSFDRHTGIIVPVSNWNSYHFFDQYPSLTDEIITSLMVEDQILENCKPIVNAIESVRALKEYGYNIHIVTSRGRHPNGFEVTKTWLDRHNVPYDSLAVTGYGIKKSTAYNKLSTCFAYMFDDSIHNIVDATNNNVITPVLISQPWNKQFNINKVDCLHHFCVSHGLLDNTTI